MNVTCDSTISIPGSRAYRGDIDGLRAIAVVAVMLFHAGAGFLPGGFTGVDIFLVISGYLIGGQILDQLGSSSFSFARFWFRRARRILPALLAMMIVTLAAGWLILMPNDFKDLGRSSVAQSVMASNFYFWLKADYFAAPSFQKPLLHTWTLSLEEQFYLLAPVVLMLLHRAGRGAIIAGLAVLLGASFAASVIWTPIAPVASFYLLPFRAWEFLVGVVLAAGAAGLTRRLGPAAANGAGIAGTVLIIAGFTVLDEDSSFPGYAALLPCVGACCLIATGSVPGNPVTRLLSVPLLAGVGRASYSLYLWHWPVLVYARYVSSNELSAGWLAVSFAATGCLALVSYRFIEMPARRAQWPEPGRRVIAGCLGAAVLAGTAGFAIDRGDGFSSRLPAGVQRAYGEAFAILRHGEPCNRPAALEGLPVCGTATGDQVPDLLVWGDSHSWAIAPPIMAIASEHGLTYSRYQCLPVLGAYRSDQASSVDDYACARFNEQMLDYIRTAGVRHVLLVVAWSRLVEPRELRMEGAGQREQFIATAAAGQASAAHAREVFAKLVPATLTQLTEAGAEVWIMKQVPQYKSWIANEFAKSLFHPASQTSLSRPLQEHRARNGFVDQVFDEVAAANLRVT